MTAQLIFMDMMNKQHKRIWWLVVILMVLLNFGTWQRPRIAQWIASRALSKASNDDPSAAQWNEFAISIWHQTPATSLVAARIARRSGDLDVCARELTRAKLMGVDAQQIEREQWLAMAQSGQLREVKSKLGQLIENPQGEEAQICEAYAQGHMRMRDFASALSLLDAWSKDYPKDARPHAWVGQIKTELRAQEEAEAAFRRSLSIDPANKQAALGLAMLLLDLKRPNESVDFFKIPLTDKRLGAEAAVGLATSLKSLSRSQEAGQVLTDALARFSDDYRLLEAKASLLIEDGKYAEAEALLREEIALGSTRREVRQTYGTALRGLGRIDEASEHFRYASEAADKTAEANRWIVDVAANPTDVELRFRIGETLLRYGNVEDGIYWLQSVLELSPNHAKAHESLGKHFLKESRKNPKFFQLAKIHGVSSVNVEGTHRGSP